jgi:integrase
MLLLKKHGDGWRSRWYGRFKQDGKLREVSLCKWKGIPPKSGRIGKDEGDRVFEASRQRALAELREVAEGERSAADQEALTARIHRARYGKRVKAVKIADLYSVWRDRPRKRKPCGAYEANVRRIIERFVDYMKQTAPRIAETGALRKEHVEGFLSVVEAEGVSARTWNVALGILRGVLLRADPYAEATRFLKDRPAMDENAIHRTPFSAEELEKIFEAAKNRDPLIHDLVVTAACTAMRRGDVCRLRWSGVDLDKGFVVVKEAKGGGTVEIPVFPPLRAVIEARPSKGAFVFPDAEKIYRQTPDALHRRLRAVLVDAGFACPIRPTKAGQHPEADPAQILTAADAATNTWSDKRKAKGMDMLRRHLRGETGREIAAALGTSPGAVSSYLHELEDLTKMAIVSAPATCEPKPSACVLGTIQPDMPRLKRPSLKGWHSFRTTWITLALAAGIPLEIVRRVTGHRTVEVVMENYFRPGRDHFRQILSANMPRALVGDGGAAKPSLAERLNMMDAKNWKQIKAELLKEVQA